MCTLTKREATLLTVFMMAVILIVAVISYIAGYRSCLLQYGLQLQKGSLADGVYTTVQSYWRSNGVDKDTM